MLTAAGLPRSALRLSDDIDEAFTRIEDFLAAQTAGGSRIELDNVLRLQESVGVDDDTRAVFVQRLSAVQPNAPAGAVLLGLLVGLSAAQLQAEKA